VVALAALKIFEGYNSGDPATLNLTTHHLDESMKFAYGERTNLGDPSFVANMTTYEANMLSEKTAEEVRAKISDTKSFNVSYYDPAGIQSLETVSILFNI
jgi:gamma-glutamyltranspeptidase/glutathione hydrolase